jgi:hypothetical protein
MLLGIVIILVFFGVIALIVARKLPIILALPLVGFVIPLIAGVPFLTVAEDVVSTGSFRYGDVIVTTIFGAVLGMVMKRCNITQTIIRKAAELGGDKPVTISLCLFAAVAIVFVGAGQMGTYVMMATIALPIMMTIGVPGVIAQSILALASHVGSIWSISNWQYFTSLLGPEVTLANCVVPVTITTVVYAAVGVAFVVMQVKKSDPALWAAAKADKEKAATENAPWYSLLTPLIPLALVFIFQMATIPAMIIGIVYGCLTTYASKILGTITESFFEGMTEVRSSIILTIGIGILVTAVRYENVATAIAPLLVAILPTTLIGYILFFSLLAPLQLYRGPMGIWGMGAGLGALMASAGIIQPVAVGMALVILDRFMAADPSLTYNIWGSDFVGCDVNDIMKKLIPYTWVVVLLSMIGAALYFAQTSAGLFL